MGGHAALTRAFFNAAVHHSRSSIIAPAGASCIGLADSGAMAIVLFCVGGFAHQMLSGALMTLSADVFDSRVVAAATGLAGSAAWIGGLAFSLIVGALADGMGYHPLFASLGVLDFMAAAVLWVLLRERRPGHEPTRQSGHL